MHKRRHVETGVKFYGNIRSRKQLAWIARLRTGHCSLNKYLNHIHKIDNPTCECRGSEETVQHYLLRCELFDEQRNRLRKEVGVEGMRVEKLLGDPKLIKNTIKYIERFES